MRKLVSLSAVAVLLASAAVSYAGTPTQGGGADRDAPAAGTERSPYRIDDSGERDASGRQTVPGTGVSVEDVGTLDDSYRARLHDERGQSSLDQPLRRGPWQTRTVGSDLYEVFVRPLLEPMSLAVIASGTLLLAGAAVYWRRRTR